MEISKFEELRIEKKYTKAELCRRAKISEPTYHSIINKKNDPSIEVLEKLSRAFNVNPGYWWRGDNSFVHEPAPEGYKKICLDCERKEKQIDEHIKTIESLNYCLEQLKARKKKGSETPHRHK